MAVEIKEVSESELPELTTRGKVLVDFYSKTCGPCKMLAFVLNAGQKRPRCARNAVTNWYLARSSARRVVKPNNTGLCRCRL